MKRKFKTISLICIVCMLTTIAFVFIGCKKKITEEDLLQPQFTSDNLLKGATIEFESLQMKEKPDAANLLKDDKSVWTPQDLNRSPVNGQPDVCNTVVEIALASTSTFNTAIIEEAGNDVQYFRIQALVDGEWINVYKSEKIQGLRLCSFDAVTTNKVRLSIDKFRHKDKAAKIKSFKLYNETKRDASDFNTTVYQRLDGDIPSEILKKSDEYIRNYARYYDVYDTVLIFGAVNWKEGKMVFTVNGGEEGFARELEALKEIISYRSNKNHNVKIICTAIADGAGGNGHTGVNEFMKDYWKSVSDQMVEFMRKYDLDGLDIDWEYPATEEDWACYDNFIARLDEGMKTVKKDAILSAALSAWSLGMRSDTLARFDQIQLMSYDGNDTDGYQSSLEQAQFAVLDLVNHGANPKQINIGIAAYGRPLNGAPYWVEWRKMNGVDLYWNNKYYNVEYSGQVFDATFCSPSVAGDKTAYALMSGIGGVMVFRLACDKTMDSQVAVACGIENALIRHIY